MKLNAIKKHHCIIGIICLAAVLRFLGVWHGYPYSYYPDEAHFVKRALAFGSFDFNPHWFHKPAFYMYLLFFEYGIYFVVGKIIGLWNGISGFAEGYIVNPGPFYMIGRVTTVFFSIGSIIVVYKIGERFFKEGTGTIAALLLSLSYGHVVTSQDIKADTPAMFFLVLSMFFLLNYTREMRMKDLLISAIIAGVGTATKKYPMMMLAPIFMGVVIVNMQTLEGVSVRLRKTALSICIALLLFIAAYFVCSPYHFIDPLGREFLFDEVGGIYKKMHNMFAANQVISTTVEIAKTEKSFFSKCIIYASKIVSTNGMGIFIAGSGIVGTILLLIRDGKERFLFLLYPVLFMVFSVIRSAERADVRHQLPLYPFLAIAGAYLFIVLAGDKLVRKRIAYAVLIIGLSVPLYQIVERDLNAMKDDTRKLAKTWIETNISPGTRLVLDENGPQLNMNKENLTRTLEMASEEDQNGQFVANYSAYLEYQLSAVRKQIAYDIYMIRVPWWKSKEEKSGVYYANSKEDRDMGNPLKPVGIMPYNYYKEKGYEYVVVVSNKYQSFLMKNSEKAKYFPSFYDFYRVLFEKGILITEFKPEESNSTGPIVKIFKIK